MGFHGQTLAHDPAGRGTHQAGDGDVAGGGAGPAAWSGISARPMCGWAGRARRWRRSSTIACAVWAGADAPVAFLNLGGVGNLTWVDPSDRRARTAPGRCLAFDTGPANAPINDLMTARRGLAQDAGGALAATGAANEEIVERFLEHPYFLRMPPKSLDRNDFHGSVGCRGRAAGRRCRRNPDRRCRRSP